MSSLTDKSTVGGLVSDGDNEGNKQGLTEHLLDAFILYAPARVKKQQTTCLPKMFAFCSLHHGIGFLVGRQKLTLLPMACTRTPGLKDWNEAPLRQEIQKLFSSVLKDAGGKEIG